MRRRIASRHWKPAGGLKRLGLERETGGGQGGWSLVAARESGGDGRRRRDFLLTERCDREESCGGILDRSPGSDGR